MKPISEQLQADILAYVEGTLPASEAARIEMVLANGDPELHQLVRGLIDDRGVLVDLPRPKAPEDLAGRIMEHVERNSLLGTSIDHQLTHEHRQWYTSRLAIAAGLLLVVGGFSYFIVDSITSPGRDHLQQWALGTQPAPTGTAGDKTGGDQLAMGGPNVVKTLRDERSLVGETLQHSETERQVTTPSASGALAPAITPNDHVDDSAPHGNALAMKEGGRLRGGEGLNDLAPTNGTAAGSALKPADQRREGDAAKSVPHTAALAKALDTNAAEGTVLLGTFPRAEVVNSLASAQPVVVKIRARNAREVTELRNTLTLLVQNNVGDGGNGNGQQVGDRHKQTQELNNGAQALTYGVTTNNKGQQEQRSQGANGPDNNALPGSPNQVAVMPPSATTQQVDKLANHGEDRMRGADTRERPVEVHEVVLTAAQLTGLLNQYAWTRMTQGQTIYDNLPAAANGTAGTGTNESKRSDIKTKDNNVAAAPVAGSQMPVPVAAPLVMARRLNLAKAAQQDHIQANTPSVAVDRAQTEIGSTATKAVASASPVRAGAGGGSGRGEQAKENTVAPLTCIFEVLAPEPAATPASNP
ncbi:MAG: hypothetical protein WCI73_01320 [Phycisphaerae bacterium]